jgi:hypothetical protein
MSHDAHVVFDLNLPWHNNSQYHIIREFRAQGGEKYPWIAHPIRYTVLKGAYKATDC